MIQTSTQSHACPPFVVVIPARLSSTRLPAKALADLGGKPMIIRVAERAQLSRAHSVVVACDDISIKKVCEAHGVLAYLTAPTHASGTDRIAECVKKWRISPDMIVVNVQGDEPLIDPTLIEAVATRVTSSMVMATAAYPIQAAEDAFDPNVVKVVCNKRGEALYFSRAPIPWCRETFTHDGKTLPKTDALYRHIGLYAYTQDFLIQYTALPQAPIEQYEMLEQLRVLWHGYTIAVEVAQTEPIPGVDTPLDLARVRGYY